MHDKFQFYHCKNICLLLYTEVKRYYFEQIQSCLQFSWRLSHSYFFPGYEKSMSWSSQPELNSHKMLLENLTNSGALLFRTFAFQISCNFRLCFGTLTIVTMTGCSFNLNYWSLGKKLPGPLELQIFRLRCVCRKHNTSKAMLCDRISTDIIWKRKIVTAQPLACHAIQIDD